MVILILDIEEQHIQNIFHAVSRKIQTVPFNGSNYVFHFMIKKLGKIFYLTSFANA